MLIEKVIIKKCCEGDDQAIAILYKDLYNVMMSICMRYQKDRSSAIEVMNMGFLKVINSLDHFDNQKPFIAWVRRILININIDVFRKEKRDREKRHEVQNYERHRLDGFSINEADLLFDADELLAMIKKLPKTTQTVFNLFALDGYSHKEIAAVINISTGTSKWHVSNARKMLIVMMEKQSHDQKIAI